MTNLNKLKALAVLVKNKFFEPWSYDFRSGKNCEYATFSSLLDDLDDAVIRANDNFTATAPNIVLDYILSLQPTTVLSIIEELTAYRECLYHIAHTMDHETEDEQDLAVEVLKKFGGRDE